MSEYKNQPIIEIEELNKIIDIGNVQTMILKEINLQVFKGECVVLKGESGSGKTTLLSIIAGMDRPSSGRVMVAGELVSKLPDMHISHFRARKIGMVFQHFNLLEHFSAAENVMIPLIPLNTNMQEVRKQTALSLELANIAHKADIEVGRLSGGEKQRVAIARALVSNPDIILCDEPTANLDRENTLKFIEILDALHQMGKTILVATHDPLFDALPFPSRILPISDGSLQDK